MVQGPEKRCLILFKKLKWAYTPLTLDIRVDISGLLLFVVIYLLNNVSNKSGLIDSNVLSFGGLVIKLHVPDGAVTKPRFCRC